MAVRRLPRAAFLSGPRTAALEERTQEAQETQEPQEAQDKQEPQRSYCKRVRTGLYREMDAGSCVSCVNRGHRGE